VCDQQVSSAPVLTLWDKTTWFILQTVTCKHFHLAYGVDI
jgi:hypothetical protein